MACRALLISLAVAAAAAALPRPSGATAADDPWRSCTTSCGNVSIAYPFGVEPGCYRDGFDLTCDHSYQPPKLFLSDGATEVTDISISSGTVRIRSAYMNITDLVLPSSDTGGGSAANGTAWGAGLRSGGPFFLAEERNKLVVVACNVQVLLLGAGGDSIVSACSALCPELSGNGTPPEHHRYLYYNGGCSGVGCCQATVPLGYTSYPVQGHEARQRRPPWAGVEIGDDDPARRSRCLPACRKEESMTVGPAAETLAFSRFLRHLWAFSLGGGCSGERRKAHK